MEQKCWTCKKYAGGCSWTRSNDDGVQFVPVDGWDASPSVRYGCGRRALESYEIRDCPEYEQDPPRAKEEKRVYGLDRPTILEMLEEGISPESIADTFDCSAGTIRKIRQDFKKEGLL